MKVTKNEDVLIDGVDYVQVYVDGETEVLLDSSELGDSDVSVELHEYGSDE